jgi:amidase
MYAIINFPIMKPNATLLLLKLERASFRPSHKWTARAGTLLGLTAAFCASGLLAADVSGDWELAYTYLGDVSYARLTLKVEDGKISGTLRNVLPLEGTVNGEGLTMSTKRPNGTHFADFVGKAHGDILEGTGHWVGDREITWSANRLATPPAMPSVHDFEPTVFHRVFSDAIAPALRIFPGDTVRTWTVDAGGVDSKGIRRCPGGNPETGPFYIEGALPGDTLVVKLNRLRLDRDTAFSGTGVTGGAVTTDYVENTKYNDNFDSTWTLDTEKGVARLKSPSTHLTNYTVKLQPMLGCIGVAPPGHQSFRTGYLGYYGGNMDYNQIREGTTVYLPVSAPGALLFIGDGHALQGDGELTGDALETSEHVEFTVNLIKGESIGNPRAENDEYVMSLGIANSLAEAVQSATTGLANWLAHDYKLEPNEIAMVLGTAIQYNIAELVDPEVHVVARIRKDILAGLK